MQYQGYPQARQGAVAQGQTDSREKFIVRTYNHLFGAIVLFALIEIGIFMSGLAEPMAVAMMGSGSAWMLVLGAFIVVSWIAVYQGFHADPTSEGVARATTSTVVLSSLSILALDFVLTAFMFK